MRPRSPPVREGENHRPKSPPREGEDRKKRGGMRLFGAGGGEEGGRQVPFFTRGSSLLRGKMVTASICRRNGITEEQLVAFVVRIQVYEKYFTFCRIKIGRLE